MRYVKKQLHSKKVKGKNKKKTEYHGMYRSPEHNSWQAMIARCENPSNIGYKNYGGRGIKVCERWRQSFLSFYDDMGKRPKGMTLDRVNSDFDYAPGNCRWATKKTQRWNSKQKLRLITLNGQTNCLQDWCKILGIRENKVRYRLSKGWCNEKALSKNNYNNQGRLVGT